MKTLSLILGFWGLAFVAKAQQDTTFNSTLKQARKLYKTRQFASSMQEYLKMLQLAEAKENHIMAAHAALNVGNCRYYINQGNRPDIIKWWYKALNIAGKYGVDSVMAKAANNIAMLYTEANKIDSAEKYAELAIKYFLKMKEYGNASACYAVSGLRNIKEPIRNFKKSWELLKRAEYYAVLVNDKSRLGYIAINRCIWHGYQKKYREAVNYADTAEKHYKAVSDWDGIRYAYSQKITYLAKLGDTTTAKYAFLWYNMTDSLLRVESAAKAAEYETLYQTEKKEKANRFLTEKTKQQQLLLIMLTIGVVSAFVIVALVIRNRKQRIDKLKLESQLKEALAITNINKEKERIARDLHDNVGGQLSYIIYSLDGINNENEETRNEVTESINESVRSVIGSLRETIWAISDANIKISDFSDKLKVFAKTLFKHTSTKVVFNENLEKDRELNALLGLNLYRICQEILNNAFKYAKAEQVTLEFKNDDNGLKIKISDNGVGFDETQISEKSKYGISNIKNRAGEFGIVLKLIAGEGKGTSYLLIV